MGSRARPYMIHCVFELALGVSKSGYGPLKAKLRHRGWSFRRSGYCVKLSGDVDQCHHDEGELVELMPPKTRLWLLRIRTDRIGADTLELVLGDG